VYADPTVFDVFSLPMIYGNPKSALADPYTVVLTESTAKKYFNKTNVIGQTIMVNNNYMYKVTGVIYDIPKQSHFNFDFFLSMSSSSDERSNANNWLSAQYNTYLLLKPGTNYKHLESQFPQLIHKYVGAQLQSIINTSYDSFEKKRELFQNEFNTPFGHSFVFGP